MAPPDEEESNVVSLYWFRLEKGLKEIEAQRAPSPPAKSQDWEPFQMFDRKEAAPEPPKKEKAWDHQEAQQRLAQDRKFYNERLVKMIKAGVRLGRY